MGRKSTLTVRTKKLIFQEKRKNPHLGVREISDSLLKKHKIKVSKSAVHSVLQSSGITLKSGRKKAFLKYRGQGITECGLLLLRSIDTDVGLFNYLADGLEGTCTKVDKKTLSKILILLSFSSFINKELTKSLEHKGFLRLADLYTISKRNINYVRSNILEKKPTFSLSPIKENVADVVTVKFLFEEGKSVLVDPLFTTFWDTPCHIPYFFASLENVRSKLERMLENKMIVVNYTKSFDYLSELALNFMRGLSKGLKRVELIDPKGNTIDKIVPKHPKQSFFIGYYPHILYEGVTILEHLGRFKKCTGVQEDIFYASSLARFSQLHSDKGVILNNVLIKHSKHTESHWAIMTNKRQGIDDFIRSYTVEFPYMDKGFLEETKMMEEFKPTPRVKKSFNSLLPNELHIKTEADFAKLAQILDTVFRTNISDITLPGQEGRVTVGKDFYRIMLSRIPKKIKKVFNKRCFYLNERRVYLV